MHLLMYQVIHVKCNQQTHLPGLQSPDPDFMDPQIASQVRITARAGWLGLLSSGSGVRASATDLLHDGA